MAMPEALNLDQLVAPISEDAPAGVALRREDGTIDPDYDKVKSAAQDARMKERELLRWKSTPDAEESQKPEAPNWRKVEQEAVRVLETKSKDLWVSAWLIEALVRTRGFVGLRDGCRMVREWVDEFWEALHPLPGPDDDEEPLEYKVSQLAGLNGTDSDGVLITPLRNVPLVDSDEFGPLALWHYTAASKIAATGDPDARQRRQDSSGFVSLDQFEKVMLSTPVAELRVRAETIRAALEEVERMDAALDAKCRDEQGTSYAPSMATIRSVVEECRSCVEQYLRKLSPAEGEALGIVADQEAGQGAAESATAGGMAGPALQAGRLQNREDAFRALLQVADYFRRTEPHSPVSYALEQAVRWGRLPLPDLLRELISDDSVRADVYRRAGIPAPPEGSED